MPLALEAVVPIHDLTRCHPFDGCVSGAASPNT